MVCDEARVIKRDVLMMLLKGGGTLDDGPVIAAPLQSLPDIEETPTTTEEKMATLFDEVSRQFTARAKGTVADKKKAVAPSSSCAPSRTLYSATSNAVNLLMGFTFSLCTPPHEFRPIKAGELRCKLPDSEYYFFKSGGEGNCWTLTT
jgi:hypothetical protein